MKLTQEVLKKHLHCDPETGIFTWLVSPARGVFVGDVAGSGNGEGYIRIRIQGTTYNASRLAFLYVEGYVPENLVDHEDRVRDNNKWSNLREASSSCNSRNRTISSCNTSGVTGVSCNSGGWVARISDSGERIYLGWFPSFLDAVMARYKAEIKYKYYKCNSQSTAKATLVSLGVYI